MTLTATEICGDVYTVIPASPGHFAPASLWARSWFDFTPRPCGLLRAQRCTIHDVKPRECRWAYISAHEKPQHGGHHLRERIARAWARPAAQRYMRALRTAVSLRFGPIEEQPA